MDDGPTLPQMPAKYDQPSLLEPADLLAYRQKQGQGAVGQPPTGALLVIQPSLLNYLVKKYRGRRISGLYGECYQLRKGDLDVMLAGGFGVGAPAAASLLEEIIAFGVREVVVLGLAGGLDGALKPGDLLLVQRALRDEGTSHHYLPPAPFAEAEAGLSRRLATALEAKGLISRSGASWTTDAPYRETALEVAAYRAAGCRAVEMELAALFSVGQFRKVAVSGLLVIADSLHEEGWGLDIPWTQVNRGLQAAGAAALTLWA